MVAKNLDDQPGLMSGRHDPVPTLPDATKMAYLGAIDEAFGSAWLDSHDDNAVGALWGRRDWLATSELLHFGRGLHAARSKGAERWLKDHVHRIRTQNLVGARGSVFEILAACMLDTAGQKVEPADPGQPGFDLIVSFPERGRGLRVSCKVLSPSEYSRTLTDWGRRFFETGLDELPPAFARHVVITTRKRAPSLPNIDALIARLRGALAVGAQPSIALEAAPWQLRVQPLAPFSTAEFFRQKVSFGVTLQARYGLNEQKRFDDKVDEACSNISRHAEATDSLGNLVLIKVPESISMEAALQYANSGPLQRYESVSGLVLFRTIVCGNGTDIGLGHELRILENPAARYPLSHYVPAKTFAVELLTGVVAGPPLESVGTPLYVRPFVDVHGFERQHHHYTRTVPKKVRNVHCDKPPMLLGLSCAWTVFARRRVDLHFTHTVIDRDLILL